MQFDDEKVLDKNAGVWYNWIFAADQLQAPVRGPPLYHARQNLSRVFWKKFAQKMGIRFVRIAHYKIVTF